MSNNTEWIAQWKSIRALSSAWVSNGERHHLVNHSFLLIIDGKASWNINGQRVRVSYGELIALEKNSLVEVLEVGNLDLAGFHIQFDIFSVPQEHIQAETFRWHLPSGNTYSYQKVQLTDGKLAGLIQYLNGIGLQEGESAWVTKQHLLYELLYILYGQLPEDEVTPEVGLQRTVTYMQEHYDQMLTRKQLAEVAGISPWHYSRKFNDCYGKPPLDFLAHYRIYRAQEELVLTTAAVQDVAAKSGFEDVHYFSRRFKQLTGISPKSYRQTLYQRRIISLSPLFAEALIHLGIIPYAVVVTPLLLSSHQRDFFADHGVKLLEVAQYEADMELVLEAQPELIIGNLWAEEVKYKLRNDGPVLTGLPQDVEPVLHQLAVWFQREEMAQQLCLHMKQEIEKARQQLQPVIQNSCTVMVLRVEAFGYRYLGGRSHGISKLLYEQLGLALPQPLQQGNAWFNACSLELLREADPDYLFVEIRKMQHLNADESMRKLSETLQWNELRAVKNNAVYYVDTCLWVNGHGVTGHRIILDEITKHLTSTTLVEAQ
ncbi:helix-turn-helix domain-containing protein [Paenibacillus silvae]|jgi:ABC-type Fe3+-hydroxamate transport system substrate-binding protein|uniref:helix-turn-helix domain-containing protein n=1 Tax=Paenibacillus silvae TaxID=1325358 RepID=UPI00259FFFB0|nr:helix-turn-helix domain-containing protein [Paenibacillus silvae]MDM5276303.1 helix-turn-helix domain-containing protein [Paenibacillus silvae]